jgi:hypothetical protein
MLDRRRRAPTVVAIISGALVAATRPQQHQMAVVVASLAVGWSSGRIILRKMAQKAQCARVGRRVASSIDGH